MRVVVEIKNKDVTIYKAIQRKDKTFSWDCKDENLLIKTNISLAKEIIDNIPTLDCCFLGDELVLHRKGFNLVKVNLLDIRENNKDISDLIFSASLSEKGLYLIPKKPEKK